MQQNKSEELILSIDAGTQSIRAALIDAGGNIIHIVKTPIQPYFSDHPGWAEQHPDYYLGNALQNNRKAASRKGKSHKKCGSGYHYDSASHDDNFGQRRKCSSSGDYLARPEKGGFVKNSSRSFTTRI